MADLPTKPRIRKHKRWKDCWQCSGGDWGAVGRSPLHAYILWWGITRFNIMRPLSEGASYFFA